MKNFFGTHRILSVVLAIVVVLVLATGIYAATNWPSTTLTGQGTLKVVPAPSSQNGSGGPGISSITANAACYYTVDGIVAPNPVTVNFGNTTLPINDSGNVTAPLIITNLAISTAVINTLSVSISGTLPPNTVIFMGGFNNVLSRQDNNNITIEPLVPGATWAGYLALALGGTGTVPIGTYELSTISIVLTPGS